MVNRRGITLESSCHGKVSYGSWCTAQGDAKHLKKKTGKAVEPYRCHYCGGIHLGGRRFGYRGMGTHGARLQAFTQ